MTGLHTLLHLEPLIVRLAALCQETFLHLPAPRPPACAEVVRRTLELTDAWTQLPPPHRLGRAGDIIQALQSAQATCEAHLGPEPAAFGEALQAVRDSAAQADTELQRHLAEQLQTWVQRALTLKQEAGLRMMVRRQGRIRLSIGDSRVRAPELGPALRQRPDLIWTSEQGYPTHLGEDALRMLGPICQVLLDEASGQAQLRELQAGEA